MGFTKILKGRTKSDWTNVNTLDKILQQYHETFEDQEKIESTRLLKILDPEESDSEDLDNVVIWMTIILKCQLKIWKFLKSLPTLVTSKPYSMSTSLMVIVNLSLNPM